MRHIIQSIFSHHKIKLEITNIKKTGKYTKLWILNNTLLNNQWIKEEVREEIRKYVEMNENENTVCQNLQDAAHDACGVVGGICSF